MKNDNIWGQDLLFYVFFKQIFAALEVLFQRLSWYVLQTSSNVSLFFYFALIITSNCKI